MPFHVEISVSTLRRARAFNLDGGELRRAILEPWVAGVAIELGDHEWLPGESSLRVLEGPELDPPELSFGQGWTNAERSARDVTRELLAELERDAPPPPAAAAIDAESLGQALAALADGERPRELDLGEALEALERRDPQVAALILVTRPGSGPPARRQS